MARERHLRFDCNWKSIITNPKSNIAQLSSSQHSTLNPQLLTPATQRFLQSAQHPRLLVSCRVNRCVLIVGQEILTFGNGRLRDDFKKRSGGDLNVLGKMDTRAPRT